MRRVLPAATVVLAALLAPATATAHGRTGRLAIDYEAQVSPLRPPLAGAVAARVWTDLAIGLTALAGHHVVVLGYQGEPLLRLGPEGAYVNAASLTAAGAGLTARRGGRGWQRYASGPRAVWHDARVHALPPGIDRRRWTIALRVDGAPAPLSGELARVAAPPAWPWLALGAVFAVAAALLLALRPRGRAEDGHAGLRLDRGRYDGPGRDRISFVRHRLRGHPDRGRHRDRLRAPRRSLPRARVARCPRPRRGLLGLLALAVGLTSIPVLLHGIVLSALPGDIARAAVVLGISAGAAAVICGLVVFVDVLAHYEEPAATERFL